MLRHMLTAAAALSLLSGVALANDLDGGSKKVITRVGPAGVSKTIVHRHPDRYGNLVTHRKTIKEGMSGSSVNRSRTVTDPMTGSSSTTKTTTSGQ